MVNLITTMITPSLMGTNNISLFYFGSVYITICQVVYMHNNVGYCLKHVKYNSYLYNHLYIQLFNTLLEYKFKDLSKKIKS